MEFKNIYECDAMIQQVENLAEANGGVVSEENMALLVKAQTSSIEKLGKLVNYVAYLESFQDVAKAEGDRIYKQRVSAAARVESIKQWLLPYVLEHGAISLGTHRISTRKSEAVVVDENFNNPEYCKVVTTTTPDKPKIKESIRAGIEVAGAKLESRLNVQIK
jgi:hypothetical protein